MNTRTSTLEQETGRVYGRLWQQYDDDLFKQSVGLLERRWLANGEAADFFVSKRCLDVGCGGGRYSAAMALLGAESVTSIDVSSEGLRDAGRRASALGLPQIHFQQGSVLDLPVDDGQFDFVLCSGVLHHTVSVERGLRELYRVVRPGGSVFLLLYGWGGMYWPLNLMMRPFAEVLGQDAVERCIINAGLAANKRRTVLDSLFCPILETYPWQRVEYLLRSTGFTSWRRWTEGRLDHEATPETMIEELEMYVHLWQSGSTATSDRSDSTIEAHLADLCRTVVQSAMELKAQHQDGLVSERQLRDAIVGEGHHRVIAERPKSS